MRKDMALVVIDVQNDFCPGGAMPVPEGDSIVEAVNEYMARFNSRGLPIFVARDWHPEKTAHFAESGGMWPPHCVRGTSGAEFHSGLVFQPNTTVVTKGGRPDQDGHTLFDASDFTGNPVSETFRARGVKHLFIGGLATDYGVMVSVLDALERGFRVTLLVDAIKGVDANPGDSEKAIEDMRAKGADTATLGDIDEKIS